MSIAACEITRERFFERPSRRALITPRSSFEASRKTAMASRISRIVNEPIMTNPPGLEPASQC